MPGGLRFVALFALLGSVSCGNDLVFAPLPSVPEAKSLLLATEDGSGLEVDAYDLDKASPPVSIPVEGRDVVLQALFFNTELEAHPLGVAPGRLISANDAPMSRPIPEAAKGFTLEVADGKSEGWVESPSRTSALDAFALPPIDVCPTLLSADLVVVDGTDLTSHFAEPLSEDMLFVGWGPAAYAWVASEDRLIQIAVPHDASGVWRSPNNELWMFGRGQISRVEMTQSSTAPVRFTPLYDFPTLQDPLRAMDRLADGRLLLLSRDGTTSLFDGSSLSEIIPMSTTNVTRAVLTRLPVTDEILVLRAGLPELFWVGPDGVPDEDSLPESRLPTGATYVDGVGLLVGANTGEIFVYRDGTWVLYAQSPQVTRIHAFYRVSNGVVFSGETGFLGWASDSTVCSLTSEVVVGLSPRGFKPFRNRLVAWGTSVGSIPSGSFVLLDIE